MKSFLGGFVVGGIEMLFGDSGGSGRVSGEGVRDEIRRKYGLIYMRFCRSL